MAPLDYQPGQLLPGTVYRVLRLIGVGGMGTVYDVEDTSIGKRYVVKTLHPKLGAREDLARRVMKEARTLARLNHPNIIEVITAGVTADDYRLPYYVMERLNGQSLRMIIDKKGRLELSHAYHIGIDLLDALDHAHDKGLIHRDVKPDNIFLHRTPGGVTVTKLLDFGIVSVLDGASSETAGRFLGTLRYAAPEQLRGESPTPKMDVYAAALVIYEIVAGVGPFDDQGDASAVGAAHLNKLAPRLSHHVPVPKELDNLIAASLAKDPRLRPRDAFSFAASLRNLSRSFEAAGRAALAEGRTTVAGVMGLVTESSPSMGPESAPATPATPARIRSKLPSSPQPPPAPAALPLAMPAATLVGMPSPTAGPSALAAVDASLQPGQITTTIPEPLDRLAATQSIDTAIERVAQNGTEAVEAPRAPPHSSAGRDDGATVPDDPPTDAGEDAIEWPSPKALVLSDEPQVRSLTSTAPRAARGPMLAAGAGVALLAMLGALALIRHPPPADPSPLALPASRPPPRPAELEVIPAPTIAPPAFDPGELSDTRPRKGVAPGEPAMPQGTASASPSPGTKPSSAASSSATPSGSARAPGAGHGATATERPGPGF